MLSEIPSPLLSGKHIACVILLLSLSLFSFSQKKDTFNLFQQTKKESRKDVAKELQSHPQSKLDSVYYIKYGTSFRKCTGYCFHEAIIDSIHIVRVNKSWQTDKNYPVKIDTGQTISDQWNMLINSIEINSFFSTPDTVGNPDAADGGSEWIEINYTGKIHKVTFDRSGIEEYEGVKNMEKLLKMITGF